MGAKLGGGGGPMADMNVTPLIDVVLVLLVVFMVITPMLQSGQSVELPQATQTTKVQDVGQFIVVSITKEGTWWVDDGEVTEDSLIDEINKAFRENPERGVLIKADAELKYGDVRKAMDLIADGGLTTVLVATEKE